jgi:hypothetical protein
MIVKAQRHLISADLTAQGYAMRNRRLSEELLGSNSEGTSDRHSDDRPKQSEIEPSSRLVAPPSVVSHKWQ